MAPAEAAAPERQGDDWSSLFEFLPMGAYRSTPEGRQLRANAALVRLNGLRDEAEQLATVADTAGSWYVDPTRRQAFLDLIERDGRVVGFESEIIRHRSGQRLWIRENAHAVRDAQGRVRYYEGTIEDISEAVATREALRQSERHLQEIVSLVPGAVYRQRVLPGGQRQLAYVSPRAAEVLGDAALHIGEMAERFRALQHPDDRARVAEQAERAVREGLPLATDLRLCMPDGSQKWVQWFSQSAAPEQGQPVRVGLITDITERKRTELSLQASQGELQQLIALIPGVVYRLEVAPDGRRRYSHISERVRDLYGVEPAEVLADGMVLARLRHPDDAASVRQRVARAIADDAPLAFESRLRLRDGREKWIRILSQAAPPADSTKVRVGVMFDVTEQRLAQQALRRQSELWMAALQASGDGVWDWRVQEGTEFFSPQCKALYGFKADELDDKPEVLDALTHPDDLPRMRADRDAHFAGQTPRYVNEHRVRCKDGQWKWILSRGLVIERDEQGRPLRMIGTHTDVTAAKQAEALRLERDNAAEADRAKSLFLSRVSHELRTPLNAVLGFAQLLELDPGGAGERQQGWVKQVLASGRHLAALLEDVLDLSSLQSGHVPVALEPVRLADVVAEAWTMLAASAAADSLQALQVDNRLVGSPLQVRGDRKRLKQIVTNLLSNAIKYNRPGGWVRVEAEHLPPARPGEAARCELRVADSGLGLSAEQQARLFRPFERLGAERSAVPGTGLGLALTLQLVQALGGDITVHSTPGLGSVFAVRLPLA